MPTQKKIQQMKAGQIYRNPFPTTDLLLEYDNGTKKGLVLIERKNPPYGWALPGGFAEWGISLGENAIKEGLEETGLEVRLIDSEERPFCVKSAPERDPRGHMISIAYRATGYGILKAGDDAKNARICDDDELRRLVKNNGLAFDHGEIVQKYLDAKR